MLNNQKEKEKDKDYRLSFGFKTSSECQSLSPSTLILDSSLGRKSLYLGLIRQSRILPIQSVMLCAKL